MKCSNAAVAVPASFAASISEEMGDSLRPGAIMGHTMRSESGFQVPRDKMTSKMRGESRHDPVSSAHGRAQTAPSAPPLSSRSLRELAHDLANVLGGARLRLALIRADAVETTLATRNLDALERLINQACEIEAALHRSIGQAVPGDAPPVTLAREATKPKRTRSVQAR